MKVSTVKIPFSDEQILNIQEEMAEVLKTGHITMGKYVKEFEKRFADYIGVKYAIGVNTGFSALEICLRAINVQNASVIVPTNTSMATPYSVLHAGGKVIFTDVLKEDLGMDPEDLERKIQKHTKAVMPVHIGGIISPRFNEIKNICQKYNLALIEDSAHAHGATIDGKKAGSLGIASGFSFYPTKVLTSGEGGVITTNDEKIYKMARLVRNYGRPSPDLNIHTEFGYNARLSEFHAIVGLEQLKRADWMLSERRRLAKIYDEKLKNVSGIELVKIPKNIESAYYKYIAYVNENLNREKIIENMKVKYDIVLPAEVYSTPCHSQPFFEKYPETVLPIFPNIFPGADFVCNQQICLPLYPGLKKKEIDYVVDALKDCIKVN